MYSHPPPHLAHVHHRPPTGPPTPDTDQGPGQGQAGAWSTSSSTAGAGGEGRGGEGRGGDFHNIRLEAGISLLHTCLGGVESGGGGIRPSSVMSGGGGGGASGHTPQISAGGTSTIGSGGGGGGGPLLPQNLAQHLNNPPAPPTSNQQQQQQLGGGGAGGHGSSGNSISIQNSGSGAGSNGGSGVTTGAGGGGKVLLMPNGGPPPAGSDEEKIYILITELLEPETREGALLELSKKRELYEDLALVLWGGFGIMSSLLLEIVAVYPALSPPSLTAHASNRVCNALALLQCVASHSDTRALFLNAHIPLFLYPFLNTTSKTRPFEYLRLTSLGVIGALVKQNDNSDVINFLLSTEIIPLCLRIMETGSELSKTVAIFIVQKILADDLGLQYICQTYERFYAVGTVLANMVDALVESQAVRLLKHVVRCYLRMSDNPRAREALRACLPKALQDNTFTPLLKGDMVTKRCLTTLLMNLNERTEA
ncbi:cell differentiation protein rcd1 [Kwoniella newhampshirensis]|uniref:Cell differentiation protein rcd1 n=1 Tax=Kwoniella newhampshirensis TaxID=1651941 RepID=A0AAW0YQQ1_9TREE